MQRRHRTTKGTKTENAKSPKIPDHESYESARIKTKAESQEMAISVCPCLHIVSALILPVFIRADSRDLWSGCGFIFVPLVCFVVRPLLGAAVVQISYFAVVFSLRLPMQNRCFSPRIRIWPLLIAGDEYASSPSLLVARTSNVGPACSTWVMPSSSKK